MISSLVVNRNLHKGLVPRSRMLFARAWCFDHAILFFIAIFWCHIHCGRPWLWKATEMGGRNSCFTDSLYKMTIYYCFGRRKPFRITVKVLLPKSGPDCSRHIHLVYCCQHLRLVFYPFAFFVGVPLFRTGWLVFNDWHIFVLGQVLGSIFTHRSLVNDYSGDRVAKVTMPPLGPKPRGPCFIMLSACSLYFRLKPLAIISDRYFEWVRAGNGNALQKHYYIFTFIARM